MNKKKNAVIATVKMDEKLVPIPKNVVVRAGRPCVYPLAT